MYYDITSHFAEFGINVLVQPEFKRYYTRVEGDNRKSRVIGTKINGG
jgi:hypothetical protein